MNATYHVQDAVGYTRPMRIGHAQLAAPRTCNRVGAPPCKRDAASDPGAPRAPEPSAPRLAMTSTMRPHHPLLDLFLKDPHLKILNRQTSKLNPYCNFGVLELSAPPP
nr:hypothetical protein Iba_chr13cCG1040 [Ipomoea batatas]